MRLNVPLGSGNTAAAMILWHDRKTELGLFECMLIQAIHTHAACILISPIGQPTYRPLFELVQVEARANSEAMALAVEANDEELSLKLQWEGAGRLLLVSAVV